MGTGSFWGDENVLKFFVVMVAQLNILKTKNCKK